MVGYRIGGPRYCIHSRMSSVQCRPADDEASHIASDWSDRRTSTLAAIYDNDAILTRRQLNAVVRSFHVVCPEVRFREDEAPSLLQLGRLGQLRVFRIQPTEVMSASARWCAVHVVAATVLLDRSPASGTRPCIPLDGPLASPCLYPLSLMFLALVVLSTYHTLMPRYVMVEAGLAAALEACHARSITVSVGRGLMILTT